MSAMSSNVTPFLQATDLSLTKDATQALAFNYSTTEAGLTTLNGQFTDADLANTYAVVIDWGDGETTSLPKGPGTIGLLGVRAFTTTHTYPEVEDTVFTPAVRLLLTETAEGRHKIGLSKPQPTGGSRVVDVEEQLSVADPDRPLV